MSEKGAVRITVLVENTARGEGILGEHGLAIWIEVGGHRVLFDTGQGMALRHNAEAMGLELAGADAIVLSHGHYDHVGGLLRASPQRMGETVAALGARQPERMVFCHCTGSQAVCRLGRVFPDASVNGHAGMVLEID